MKNEAAFKTAFKKSLRAQKGFSMTLACPTFSGVPDLFVISKGHMPVMLEAKWLGDLKTHNFSRKIPYTAMQINWMEESNQAQPNSALGMIGFKFQNEYFCVLTPSGVTQLNYSFKRMWPWVVYNKGFDVQDLFDQSQIPRMNLQRLFALPKTSVPANVAKVDYLEMNGTIRD